MQFAISVALMMVIFIVLVNPAIMSLEAPPNSGKSLMRHLYMVLASLNSVFAFTAAVVFANSSFSPRSAFLVDFDLQALTCTRRC